MAKERLQAAKELIQQKRYDEARRILEGIDHPTAEKWLAQLPAGSPKSKASNTRSEARSMFFAGVAFALVGALALGGVIGFFLGRESVKAEIANAFNSVFATSTPVPGATETQASVHMTETAIPLTYEMRLTEIPMTAQAIKDTAPTADCDPMTWVDGFSFDDPNLVDTLEELEFPPCVSLSREYLLEYARRNVDVRDPFFQVYFEQQQELADFALTEQARVYAEEVP
jgi:hypothetical protein